MRLFTGRAYAKFTMCTASSYTEARSAGKVLATRVSRRKKQCVTITSGFLSFTLLTKPLVRPTIAAAPLVQTLVQFSHSSPSCLRYSDVTRKISSPVAFSGDSLQNRKFWPKSPNAHWPRVKILQWLSH